MGKSKEIFMEIREAEIMLEGNKERLPDFYNVCENCRCFSNEVKKEYLTEMYLCPECQPEI